MLRDDPRNSLCEGCQFFALVELDNYWICRLDQKPLRLGRYKVPRKNQMCGGPYYHERTTV
jgi:hypothetical protein